MRQDDRLEVCLINPVGRRVWGLPKGGVEPGETPAQAALREIAEETGMSGVVEGELGSIDYWFYARDRGGRIHKTVHYFLVRATGGHHRRVTTTRSARRAGSKCARRCGLMTYPNEREMVRKAAAALGVSLDGVRTAPGAG